MTKSFVSMLIGKLVDDGLLSLEDRMGDIWPSKYPWLFVKDAHFKQNATLREVKTHMHAHSIAWSEHSTLTSIAPHLGVS